MKTQIKKLEQVLEKTQDSEHKEAIKKKIALLKKHKTIEK